jgi:DNA polymerase III sliding clamp (beta) subunit (PCNA family)
MHIRLPAKELAHALTGLMKVITQSATLPVLRAVRIEARDHTVTLTATDLDTFVIYTCRSAEIKLPGTIIVADTKRLKAIVQSARHEEAVIRVLNPDTCEVGLHGPDIDRLHVLVTINAGEWPEAPDEIETTAVDPVFLHHYRMLVPFTTTDSTRQILEGICCEIQNSLPRQFSLMGGNRRIVSQ